MTPSTIIKNLFSIIDFIFYYRLFSHKLGCRFSKKTTIIIYIILFSSLLAFPAIASFLLPKDFPENIALYAILYSIFFLIHCGSIIQRLLWLSASFFLMMICELVSIPIILLVTDVPFSELNFNTHTLIIGYSLSRALLLVITEFVIRFKHHIHIFSSFIKELAIILAVDSVFCFVSANLFFFDRRYVDEDTAITFSFCFMVLFTFMTLYTLYKVAKKSKEMIDTNLRLQQIEMENKLNEDMSLVVENLRSLRHDMNNHMSVLQGLVSMKEYHELENYLASISKELAVANSYIFVENKALSVLINNKMTIATQRGITFDTEILTSKTPLSDRDLCAMIGNILENAIDAASSHETPYIYFSMKKTDNALHITCKNTYTTAPILENGNLITTKDNKSLHGIGTKNIRSIVESYKGTVSFSAAEQFLVNISIPI